MLCIAHRLHTVAYYDQVLVMDKGRVLEFSPPLQLMQQQGSRFREMCESTGAFDELVAIASEDKTVSPPAALPGSSISQYELNPAELALASPGCSSKKTQADNVETAQPVPDSLDLYANMNIHHTAIPPAPLASPAPGALSPTSTAQVDRSVLDTTTVSAANFSSVINEADMFANMNVYVPNSSSSPAVLAEPQDKPSNRILSKPAEKNPVAVVQNTTIQPSSSFSLEDLDEFVANLNLPSVATSANTASSAATATGASGGVDMSELDSLMADIMSL